MTETQELTASIYEGWHTFQGALIKALQPLETEQLALRVSPNLRSVGQIARHIIGARARWFYMLMGEGGEEFAALGKWDRRDAPERSAQEIVNGLETTWRGMHEAIARWTPEQWQKTIPFWRPIGSFFAVLCRAIWIPCTHSTATRRCGAISPKAR